MGNVKYASQVPTFLQLQLILNFASHVLNQATLNVQGATCSIQGADSGVVPITLKTSTAVETRMLACKLLIEYIHHSTTYRGRNPPENNLLGACGEGYSGILCNDCKDGYYQTDSDFKCTKCGSGWRDAASFVGLFLFLLIFILILVRSAIQGALKEKNYISVFLRILLNHFQLVTITA